MGRPRTKARQHSEPARVTCVIYARVSTKEQQEEGFSIDAQLALLRAYADRQGLEVRGEYVEAETGAKSSKRPVFAKMLEDIGAHRIQAIVVEKTDRIYRNFKDYVTVDELGVDLHLVKESTVLTQTSRSHEKLVHGIKVVMAKGFIDNLREEITKGMTQKAKAGIWPSAAPLGYRNTVQGHIRVIEPDPVTAPIVAAVFAKFATGEVSVKRVRELAVELGLKSLRGGKPIPNSSLHRMLRNPIYCGRIEWNGEEYAGKHEPIVTPALWNKVQAVLDGRAASAPPVTRQEYAFAGLIRCGECGCLMSPYTAKGRYVYYACTGARGCRRRGYREEIIIDEVVRILQGLQIRPEVLESLRLILKETHQEQSQEQRKVEANELALIDRLRARRERLYTDRLDGEISIETYRERKDQIDREIAAIQARLAAADRAQGRTWEQSFAILETVSNSAFEFKSANPARQRQMAKMLVSNFNFTAGRLRVELRPWFNLIAQANLTVVGNEGNEALRENWYSGWDSNPRSSP